MFNEMAYCTCFEDENGERTLTWDTIMLFECFTSHAWAGALLRDEVQSLALRRDYRCYNDDDELVKKWHETVIAAQHSDEFMAEVTDRLLWSNMFEFEEQAPETQRVFRDSKPRNGYHWYTRLRAFRDGELCNELYNRCNLRTYEIECPLLKSQTLLSYIEYHMRHAGVPSWLQVCYVDYRYPKAARRVLDSRRHVAVGQPIMPPLILYARKGEFVVVDCDMAVYSKSETIHGAFKNWSQLCMERLGGMIAPRVSCISLLQHVLESEVPDTSIDLHASFKRTSYVMRL